MGKYTDQKREQDDLEYARKYGASTPPPNLSDYKGMKGSYSKWKRDQREWRSKVEDEYNEGPKLTPDQMIDMRGQDIQARGHELQAQSRLTKAGYERENANNRFALDNYSTGSRLGLDREKFSSENSWKQIEALRKDNEYAATTIDPTSGEKVIDYNKLANLNGILAKNMQSMGISSGGQSSPGGMMKLASQTEQPAPGGMMRAASQSSPDMLSYVNSLPEEQKQALSGRFKARTNEWGDDLTKSAPAGTTTYKDGMKTFSYPGVTDPKTGEVRNSLSTISANETEEGYGSGVYATKTYKEGDGPWPWGKQYKIEGPDGSIKRIFHKDSDPWQYKGESADLVKRNITLKGVDIGNGYKITQLRDDDPLKIGGGGGGFLMRGGLSDLGHALAGDAPRVVAPPAQAVPARMSTLQYAGPPPPLDQGKYFERMARSNRVNPSAREMEKSPGIVSKSENGRQVFYKNTENGMVPMSQMESIAHVESQPVLSQYKRPAELKRLNPTGGMWAKPGRKVASLWDQGQAQSQAGMAVNDPQPVTPRTPQRNIAQEFTTMKNRLNEKYPGPSSNLGDSGRTPLTRKLSNWRNF